MSPADEMVGKELVPPFFFLFLLSFYLNQKLVLLSNLMIPLKPNPSESSMIDHIRSSLRACFKGNRRLSATTIDSLVKGN